MYVLVSCACTCLCLRSVARPAAGEGPRDLNMGMFLPFYAGESKVQTDKCGKQLGFVLSSGHISNLSLFASHVFVSKNIFYIHGHQMFS